MLPEDAYYSEYCGGRIRGRGETPSDDTLGRDQLSRDDASDDIWSDEVVVPTVQVRDVMIVENIVPVHLRGAERAEIDGRPCWAVPAVWSWISFSQQLLLAAVVCWKNTKDVKGQRSLGIPPHVPWVRSWHSYSQPFEREGWPAPRVAEPKFHSRGSCRVGQIPPSPVSWRMPKRCIWYGTCTRYCIVQYMKQYNGSPNICST